MRNLDILKTLADKAINIKVYDVKSFMIKYKADDELETSLVEQWCSDKVAKAVCYEIDDNIVSFALISVMDFDPKKKYKKPTMVNYIFTYPYYRCKGYGSYICSQLIKYLEITTFPSNDKSLQFFVRNKLKHEKLAYLGTKTDMLRYP